MNNNDIAILIPAYNPTIDLIEIVDNLVKRDFKVIVVNDGSNNESIDIFNKLNKNIILLKHEQNMGKGQALKTGFEYIINNISCIGVITVDADGQHILKDIIKVVENLSGNENSIILGSRLDTDKMLFRSKLGNCLTRIVFKFATKTDVFDTQTGLRGIPFKYLKDLLTIEGQRYEYEINMLLYCTQNSFKIKEIPIETIYLNNNKSSSFNVIKDSFKIYKCILKNSNCFTGILYTLSAIISFFIDFLLLITIYKCVKSSFSEDISLLISVVFARAVSSLFNFLFNRNIVFRDKSNILISFIKYYLLVIFVLIVNYILLDILAVKFSFNLKLSKLLVELIIFINNYIIQKLFIFKNRKHI